MDPRHFDTRPKALEIKKIIKENDTTNTYIFEYALGARPGQFVMMWIPGVDEKPFSVAYDNGSEFWITICKVGPATEKLFELKEGDKVGIRGPFGTFYEYKKGDHIATVAGGYGAAPMYFVAREASENGCQVEFIVGARNKDLLLYIDRVKKMKNVNLHVATDDGSMGVKGFTTHVLQQVLNDFAVKKGQKITKVFTCGPEIMEKFVGKMAEENNVDCFISAEKYMKCGFGVCGQCAIDDTGEPVCLKGPVMNYQYLKNLSEFGKYHRDAQGKKRYFGA